MIIGTNNRHFADAFVSSVVEFALILRNSEYKGNASYESIIKRLEGAQLTDEYKLEFLNIVKESAK